MKRILGFIFHPVLLRVLGAICLGLLIWFAGPLLAFADWHPLDAPVARIVVFVVLLLLWFGRRMLLAMRDAIANRRLFESLGAKDAATPAAGAPDPGQAAEVRKRFDQAMAVLRESRFGASQGRAARWFGGNRYVYQLPWYLFIGAPGSGKTTALLNSGLQFPLAERLGHDPIRGVGGTRNCEWWFTDQAVMIDTAGRYTTQDSDARSDADEWGAFLGQLRRFRPRQPINGVLVTVSVSDLLQMSAADRERQAVAVRNRIQELLKTLDNAFPVYLLVTKADLLAGFMEFFGDLDREQREAVWGSTFTFDATGGTAPGAADFRERFDELVQRIEALTLDRLQAERDLGRRAAIHGFVHQLAAIGPALEAFAATAFPGTSLARQPMLRGFYLASGTQEGNPIDRVMGTLARRFGLQRKLLPALRPTGKSFFLTRLLREVVFVEAGLAGTNLRRERRLRLLRWLCAGLAVTTAVVAIAGWTISYFGNAAYLDAVEARTTALKQSLAGQSADGLTLSAMPPLYASVLTLPRTPEVDPAAPGWRYRFGLFQGDKLAEAVDQSYHRLLAQTLAPALAARIASVLRKGAANPELQYETLKTYVMLRTPGRLDASAVKGWVAFDLATSEQGQAMQPDARKQVLAHLDALLSRGAFQDAVPADDALLADVRASLTRTPFPQRVYNRLKRQGVGSFNDFRITNAGGASAALVFARRSGASLEDGVPGLYTFDGYNKGFSKALEGVIADLAAEETWVLGIQDSDNAKRAANPVGRASLVDEVKRLYLLDYIATWERFIGDIGIVQGGGLSQTIETARILSSADSPLPRLLKAIVREVSLTDSEVRNVTDKLLEKPAEAVRDTRDTLNRLLGEAGVNPIGGTKPPGRVESMVDDRFEPLRRLVKAPQGGQAPLDQTVALINEMYQQLNATDTAVRSGMPPPPSDVPNKVKSEAARLPEPLRSILSTLAASGSSQALGATRANLSQDLNASVSDYCGKAINGRYPFDRSSRSDVTPEDFARLFGPGGVFDSFFQSRLAALVDTGVKPWRFRKTDGGLAVDSASLVQFQYADDIRSVFFPGGAKAVAIRVQIRPVDMDPAIQQFSIDFDGQELKFTPGASVPLPVQWPGPRGTNQIRIQMTPPGPGGQSSMTFDGPWAIFRLFDRARIEDSGQPEKFRATFTLDGRNASFDVTASSVRNPFRLSSLQAFRCPSRL